MRAGRAGIGTPGDCFALIVVAASNRKPLFVSVSEQVPKPCAVSRHDTAVCCVSPAAVLYFM